MEFSLMIKFLQFFRIESCCSLDSNTLLTKVVPLCKDLGENADTIKAVSTNWERIFTELDFEEAATR